MLHYFKLLPPITVDSHFGGEYLAWAWDIVDHRGGILDFYDYYRAALTVEHKPEIELKVHERVVPLLKESSPILDMKNQLLMF